MSDSKCEKLDAEKEERTKEQALKTIENLYKVLGFSEAYKNTLRFYAIGGDFESLFISLGQVDVSHLAFEYERTAMINRTWEYLNATEGGGLCFDEAHLKYMACVNIICDSSSLRELSHRLVPVVGEEMSFNITGYSEDA